MRKTLPRLFKRFCGLFVLLSLFGCLGGKTSVSPGTAVSVEAGCETGSWIVLRKMDFGQPTLSVMFRDASFGISTDLAGGIYYSEDGGDTWNYAATSGLSRVALEMTGDLIWHVGYGGSITRSSDDGHTWQVMSSLPYGGHIEYMTFADETTGWAVTTELRSIFATHDGARTWEQIAFPEQMGHPAAIHLRTPVDGYLLDTAGALFVTIDGGETWKPLSLDLPAGSTVPVLNHSAAMRFTDAQHGFIALNLISGGSGRVLGLRTEDAGATWTEVPLPVPMGMFHLTRDGIYLTHVDLIDHGKITVLCLKR
jgi:hypothetical protein